MQNSDDTLRRRYFGLIPREPVIDFGTVEIGVLFHRNVSPLNLRQIRKALSRPKTGG